MKRSRFTEEQIIGMLKEQEAGMPTSEVCRKRDGGMPPPEAKWVRQLEDETNKLMKIGTEMSLDTAM